MDVVSREGCSSFAASIYRVLPPTLQPTINGGDGGGELKNFEVVYFPGGGGGGGAPPYLLGGPGTVLPGIILWLISSHINN